MAKIGYVSDTHIDFFAMNSPGKIRRYAKSLVPEEAQKKNYYDAIIVAGDIGHYNKDNIVFLNKLKDYTKNVVCVLGNHDWYLVGSQPSRYSRTSKLRVEEFETMCRESRITLLNPGYKVFSDNQGKAFSILGFNGWYDGKYQNNDPVLTELDWRGCMNDSRMIMPSPMSYNTMHELDMKAVDAVINRLGPDCTPDIVVSHVRPTINPWKIEEKYRRDANTRYYCFDGSELMQKLKPKYWIFGHSHDAEDFEEYDVQVVTNAVGYPGEYSRRKTLLKEINI